MKRNKKIRFWGFFLHRIIRFLFFFLKTFKLPLNSCNSILLKKNIQHGLPLGPFLPHIHPALEESWIGSDTCRSKHSEFVRCPLFGSGRWWGSQTPAHPWLSHPINKKTKSMYKCQLKSDFVYIKNITICSLKLFTENDNM